MAWYHEYIDLSPKVCGGYPVIKGTRISVRDIVESVRQGLKIADILDAYPHIDKNQVEAALAYYLNEPELVDEDILQNEEAWQQLISQSWPDSE